MYTAYKLSPYRELGISSSIFRTKNVLICRRFYMIEPLFPVPNEENKDLAELVLILFDNTTRETIAYGSNGERTVDGAL
jgi:hypothetical protein